MDAACSARIDRRWDDAEIHRERQEQAEAAGYRQISNNGGGVQSVVSFVRGRHPANVSLPEGACRLVSEEVLFLASDFRGKQVGRPKS